MTLDELEMMRAEDDGMAVRPAALRVGDTITGVRHDTIAVPPRTDGGTGYFAACRCGCEWTAGLQGTVIELDREMDVVVARFEIPSAVGGGDAVKHLTAYSLEEVQS